MKGRVMKRVLHLSLLTVILAGVCYGGVYSGGSGTESEPYLIATVDDILEMSQTSADWDKHFKMTADIDLAGQTFDTAVVGDLIEVEEGGILRCL